MKKFLALIAALCFGTVSAESLTDAQMQTLADAIRADTDQEVITALAAQNYGAIAANYNKPGTFTVWRTLVSPAEYRKAIVWSVVDGLTAGKRDSWQWQTSNMTSDLDPSDANVRAGIADVWGAGSATGLALTALEKRNASKAEALFATGTGTTASPGTMTFEGALEHMTVSSALERF